MKSKITIVLIIFTLLGCDRESVLTTTETPAELTEYVTTHFSNNKILQVIKDVDGLTKTYNVTLNGGIS